MTVTSGVKLREPRHTDMAFVIDSWIKSNRRAAWHAGLSDGAYYDGYRPVVAALLSRPDTRCVVACNPEDEDQVFGYAVWTPGKPLAIHYVYVKDILRRRGVATDMVKAIAPEFDGAVITALGKQLGPELSFGQVCNTYGLRYEPYRLWSLIDDGKRKSAG